MKTVSEILLEVKQTNTITMKENRLNRKLTEITIFRNDGESIDSFENTCNHIMKFYFDKAGYKYRLYDVRDHWRVFNVCTDDIVNSVRKNNFLMPIVGMNDLKDFKFGADISS